MFCFLREVCLGVLGHLHSYIYLGTYIHIYILSLTFINIFWHLHSYIFRHFYSYIYLGTWIHIYFGTYIHIYIWALEFIHIIQVCLISFNKKVRVILVHMYSRNFLLIGGHFLYFFFNKRREEIYSNVFFSDYLWNTNIQEKTRHLIYSLFYIHDTG